MSMDDFKTPPGTEPRTIWESSWNHGCGHESFCTALVAAPVLQPYLEQEEVKMVSHIVCQPVCDVSGLWAAILTPLM